MNLATYLILSQSHWDKQRRTADGLRAIQENQPGYPTTGRVVWETVKALAWGLSAVAAAGLIVYGLTQLGAPE